MQPVNDKHNWPLPYLGILLKLYDLDFLNRKIKLIRASFYPEHNKVQVLKGWNDSLSIVAEHGYFSS